MHRVIFVGFLIFSKQSLNAAFSSRKGIEGPLSISQADVAGNLGVTRKTLSMLLNGHQGISAEMALRLGKAFATTPEFWLNMQCNYDLWNAGQHVKLSQIKVFRKPRSVARRP